MVEFLPTREKREKSLKARPLSVGHREEYIAFPESSLPLIALVHVFLVSIQYHDKIYVSAAMVMTCVLEQVGSDCPKKV